MIYKIGDKVKLHKVAFDWMNLLSRESKSGFEFELWRMIRMSTEESEINSLINYNKVSIIDLVNAYQFGYELEETKEDNNIKIVKGD